MAIQPRAALRSALGWYRSAPLGLTRYGVRREPRAAGKRADREIGDPGRGCRSDGGNQSQRPISTAALRRGKKGSLCPNAFRIVPPHMKSMTGYGRGEGAREGFKVTVELSSVNRKQSEIALNLPRDLEVLESRIRDAVNRRIARGRVTARVLLHAAEGAPGRERINLALAGEYARDFRELATDGVAASTQNQAFNAIVFVDRRSSVFCNTQPISSVPEGHLKIAQHFSAGSAMGENQVPIGTDDPTGR